MCVLAGGPTGSCRGPHWAEGGLGFRRGRGHGRRPGLRTPGRGGASRSASREGGAAVLGSAP